MLLIISLYFLFAAVSAVAMLLSYMEYGYKRNYWVPNLIKGFIVTACLVIIIPGIIIGKSYTTYLKMLAYYNVITQYEEAIEKYDDSIVLDIEKVVTDFAYQGHARALSDLIKDLRDKVVEYNSEFVVKKALAKNIFFGELIIKPDPYMKIIHIKRHTKIRH